MSDLLVIVPSRGRPQNVARLCEAFQKTCRADTSLEIAVDQDDPSLAEYLRVARDCEVIVGKPSRLNGWLNRLAVLAAKDYLYLGHMGDDNVPMTDGWDEAVIQCLATMGTGLCFSDDLDETRKKGDLPCHVFMTSDIVESLGYFAPPGFLHMYIDFVWLAWGKACGIRFLPEVVIEHRHFMAGKAEQDASYISSRKLVYRDAQAYNEYVSSGQCDADIKKIRDGRRGVWEFEPTKSTDTGLGCQWPEITQVI